MEIKGYTLHGDYYLADKVIPNKTWEEACKMKEVVILPNGKKVIAHTLSKEELETISDEERGMGNCRYWTSTINDKPLFVSYSGGFGSITYRSDSAVARLGFKNPF